MPPNDMPDLEALLGDGKIPELMLQDDGDLFRILRAQPLRHAHALGARIEGDVEMVLARQAFLGDVGEHLAHDVAQRLLGQKIVADMVGHDGSEAVRNRILARLAAKGIPAQWS